MESFFEIGLALFAVIGILSVGWICFGSLVAPAGGRELCLVLPAQGDGEELEYTLTGVLWLRGSGLLRGRVIIADCGLSAAGREAARLLCGREPDIGLCPAEDVTEYIGQTGLRKGGARGG